jgi:DNA-directed RNA polymerase beta subunit
MSWELIDAYFTSNPRYISQHQLDAYNTFMVEKLAYTVRAMNPIRVIKNDDTLRVDIEVGENVYLDPPTYVDDKGARNPLLPNVARMRNLYYASDLRMDVRVSYYENDKLVGTPDVYERHFFGRIPVMLQSKLCALHGLTQEELTEAGGVPIRSRRVLRDRRQGEGGHLAGAHRDQPTVRGALRRSGQVSHRGDDSLHGVEQRSVPEDGVVLRGDPGLGW